MTEKKEETKKEAVEAKEETLVKEAHAKKEHKAKTKEKPAKEKEPEAKEKNQGAKEAPKTETKKEETKVAEKPVKNTDEAGEGEKQTNLVETEKYLNTGAHIGTKFKTGTMKRYIYKARKDGLNVLDVQMLDERLGLAAKFLAGFSGPEIIVVSRKVYGQTPAKTFADSIGAKAIISRFVPGTFTNPESNHFTEPKAVMITDPDIDSQAILEATKMRIPVVALASTSNNLTNIDICVPINNKGKKSLALAYWILAREILKERGDIKDVSAFSKSAEDFEYKMKEEDAPKKPFQRRKTQWQSNSSSRGRGRR